MCQEAGGDCTARTVNVTDRDAVGAVGCRGWADRYSGQQCGRGVGASEEIAPRDHATVAGDLYVNVTAAFDCAQAVAPGMKAAGWGRIVNISSGAGLGISLTGIQAYASAKAAEIGLTRRVCA